MKLTAILVAPIIISCSNKKAEQDQQKIDQLTEENQTLKDEAAQKKG